MFYDGDAFPAWRNHMLVGSLRAADLFRVEIDDGDRFVRQETLIEDLARIRDIEVGVDGLVYLLLERATGWRIVQLVPASGGGVDRRGQVLGRSAVDSAWVTMRVAPTTLRPCHAARSVRCLGGEKRSSV